MGIVKSMIILFLFTIMLLAAELGWADGYEEAQKQAVSEKKDILVILTKKTCRWCRKLEKTTLKNKAVINRIQRRYIPVHLTRNKDDYPSGLVAKMVPVSYFLFSDGTQIMRAVKGYWSAEDYLSIMDDVDRYRRKHETKMKEAR